MSSRVSRESPVICRPSRTAALALGLLAAACIAAFAAPPPGKGKTPPAPPPENLLLFPTGAASGVPASITRVVSDVVKGRLAASGKYAVDEFSVSNPTVRRALSDHTISRADATPPFDTASKIRRLSNMLGYRLAVTSSVDAYDFDPAQHRVLAAVTVSLLDLTGAKPHTGTSAQSITTAANSTGDAADTSAAEQAVRTEVEKMMTSILKPPAPAPPAAHAPGV